MNTKTLTYITICLLSASCGNNTIVKDVDISMTSDRMSVDTRGQLVLASYNVSAISGPDSILAAYNYKSHSIDRFDLKSRQALPPVQLAHDGPDGIPGQVNTIAFLGDSTYAVNDGIRHYIVDSDGHVANRYEYPMSGYSLVSRNARMHSARLSVDSDRLVYPVFHGDTISMAYFTMADSMTFRTTELTRLPDGNDYGFMRYPNTAHGDSVIIYNYPYESAFTVIDTTTGDRHVWTDLSRYAPDQADKCPKGDPDKIMSHGIVNPHYFEIDYLPALDMYVQLYLGVPRPEYADDLAKAMYSRPLCLKLFDATFNKIGEWRLDDDRFDPYMGWLILDDGVLLFESNGLDQSVDDDENTLRITILRFLPSQKS